MKTLNKLVMAIGFALAIIAIGSSMGIAGWETAGWQTTNIPYGGNVNALIVKDSDLFTGTNVGAFRSSDNGTSWKSVNNGLMDSEIYSFAVSGSTIFAGAGWNGVFRSDNNGKSWSQLGIPESPYVMSLAVNGSNIFAGTDGKGVFLSVNNGDTWTAVNTGLTTMRVFEVAVNGGDIFAGTDKGLFKSADNGANWSSVLTNLSIQTIAASGSNIFVGTWGQGVYISSDNGKNWTQKNTGLTNTMVLSLAIKGATIFAGTNGGKIFASSDNGANWTLMSTGLTSTVVNALIVSGANIFAGTWGMNGGGVFLSANNGASWTPVNNGLTGKRLYSPLITDSGIFAGTYRSGLLFSADNGKTWTSDYTPTYSVFSMAANGSTLLAGGEDGVIYLSSDKGKNWKKISTDFTQINIGAIAINGTTFYAGTWGDGIFVSSDNGVTWTKKSEGLTNKSIKDIVISGANVFAATSGGGVFLSTNNGTTWTPVNTGLSNLYVRNIAVSGSNLFAATAAGVFLSSDNGAKWTAVNNGLMSLNTSKLAISGSDIFAGTYGQGVFRSSDNGANWNPVNNGLPNVFANIQGLAVSGSNVFASVHGQGLWGLSKDSSMTLKVGDDLALNVSGSHYFNYHGNGYGFTLNYYSNPNDPAGVYWKADVNTLKAQEPSGIFFPIDDRLNFNIFCAEFHGNLFGFTLNYYPNPADPSGFYWKADLSTFTQNPRLEPNWTTGGVITDTAGTPIENATVSVPLKDKVYSGNTNRTGEYTLTLPQTAMAPRFAGTLKISGFKSETLVCDFSGDDLICSGTSPKMMPTTEADIVFPKGLTVIHLGDDSYAGSANSQLQVRASGLIFEDSFNLTQAQLSKYRYLTVSMYARGVQTASTHTSNEIALGTRSDFESGKVANTQSFAETAADGSFTPVSYRFDLSSLSPGEIILRINSSKHSTGDYDDFEVTNITGKLE